MPGVGSPRLSYDAVLVRGKEGWRGGGGWGRLPPAYSQTGTRAPPRGPPGSPGAPVTGLPPPLVGRGRGCKAPRSGPLLGAADVRHALCRRQNPRPPAERGPGPKAGRPLLSLSLQGGAPQVPGGAAGTAVCPLHTLHTAGQSAEGGQRPGDQRWLCVQVGPRGESICERRPPVFTLRPVPAGHQPRHSRRLALGGPVGMPCPAPAYSRTGGTDGPVSGGRKGVPTSS